jgi:tetratricopeptide (TPR) repeat protein/glutathione synthase/RimK-type ligase-like ATP-grasp enzyme
VTKTADDIQSTTRERAIALHQAGKVSEAAAIYETLLAVEPANADLWWLLSTAQLRLDRNKEALASWRKCLAIETAVPLRLRNITSFLLTMQQKDELEAQLLDGLDIPDWPKDLPPDQDSQSMILALALCLIDFGRHEAAFQLLNGILEDPPTDLDFLAKVAPIVTAAGKSEKILDLLRPLTSGAHRDNGALLIAHAAAATAAQHREEAENVSLRARDAVPVFLSAETPNQRLLIGVLNRAPKFIRGIWSPARLHFFNNMPATLFAKMNDEFRFLSIFPEAASANEALKVLPEPRLIINNWVNPEILSDANTLEFIADYADSFGLPVINHPRRACFTTRQRNAERLAGIPGVVVPRTMRVINDPQKRELLVRIIGEQLGFPVIIRNPFGQKGWETVRVATPAELAACLSTMRQGQLYAIQYIHNPVPEGAFRKIRAAVIGGELFMLNVYFGAQWNVHRTDDRALAVIDLKGTATAVAQKILRHPDEALGKAAMTALHEIQIRTPLDMFGIDFDLLPDGRVLFFEANAAMNLHMREKEDVPETLLAMREAYRRLFENPPPRSYPGRPH